MVTRRALLVASGFFLAQGQIEGNGLMPQVPRPVDWLKVEAQRGKYLRQYHRALMNRANAPVDIICIGDSETEGYKATVFGADGTRYPDVLREAIRDRWQPAGIAGGEGYVPAGHQAPVTDRWTYSGGAEAHTWGLGRRARLLNASGNTMSITVQCTGIDILWAGSSLTDVFSYAIDGGSATNVDTTLGALTGGNVTQIRGLSSGSHTLLISRVSGSSVIEGIMVYDGDESLGVRMWEAGHSTYKSGDYVGLASASGREWIHSVGTAQPDLVLIALGVNDYYFGDDPSVLRANLTQLVADVRGECTVHPSIVFIVQPKRDDTAAAVEPYSAYVNAVYAAARSDGNVGVINLDVRFWAGSETPYASGVGLIDVDKIHPTDLGYAYWARAVAGYLEP